MPPNFTTSVPNTKSNLAAEPPELVQDSDTVVIQSAKFYQLSSHSVLLAYQMKMVINQEYCHLAFTAELPAVLHWDVVFAGWIQKISKVRGLVICATVFFYQQNGSKAQHEVWP